MPVFVSDGHPGHSRDGGIAGQDSYRRGNGSDGGKELLTKTILGAPFPSPSLQKLLVLPCWLPWTGEWRAIISTPKHPIRGRQHIGNCQGGGGRTSAEMPEWAIKTHFLGVECNFNRFKMLQLILVLHPDDYWLLLLLWQWQSNYSCWRVKLMVEKKKKKK